MKQFNKKGNNYFIVARNGKTSAAPFPHPSLKLAQAEAERLALSFPNSVFYVYAAYFKISVSSDTNKIIKTYLRYKAKKSVQPQ
jgi:hypothetical protein